MNFYCKEIDETIKILESSKNGLSEKDAKQRLKNNGYNEIKNTKKKSVFGIFFSQFADFMIIILLISAVISASISFFNKTHEYYDFFIILTIVICNGIIGTVQEIKAEKAIDSLKKMTSQVATVIRNNQKTIINSSEIVVGDIVLVKTGDVCPADIRLIDSVELQLQESSLTGESQACEKDAFAKLSENTVLSERKTMIFSGTGVDSGYGKGIVVATGMDTEIGKIANLIQNEESPETPLQIKLNQTGKILGIGVLIICAIIFILGLFKGIEIIEMLMISISLAVAAIPEGLTAVVTIVLAMGVKRMAYKKAIIRKLSATETLGSVNIICSDKTGTLTENKMTVVKTYLADKEIDKTSNNEVLAFASLCNNSEKIDGKYVGLPTEIAIKKSSEKYIDTYIKIYPRIGEIPFTSKRKLMTTIHKDNENYLVITKGAPDYLLKLCSHIKINSKIVKIDNEYKSKIQEYNNHMAENALRVLGVAIKYTDNIQNDEIIESNLVFIGLIGLEDPPRKEAKEAVEKCKLAGIKPVMITGDQEKTAIAIAKRIGIYSNKDKHMNGMELSKYTAEELSKIINSYTVFSRVSPEDKVKIVKAFQINKKLIAMTGDGVNDAPALKVADIGCAMGKNGTDVAKSAADMVLTDDNFATIVEAVKEGRGIFLNIKKTVHFLLSCNMGEIILIFLSFLMGLPVPLLATQILWVNLVTDSFPALALGASKNDDDIMNGEFKPAKDGILNRPTYYSMILEGSFIGIMALLAFIIGKTILNDINVGRTMSFAVLCLSQLIHSFNLSSNHSMFSSERKHNPLLILSAIFCTFLLLIVIVYPPLGVAFSTVPLNLNQWIYVIVLSLCPLVVVELEKLTIN